MTGEQDAAHGDGDIGSAHGNSDTGSAHGDGDIGSTYSDPEATAHSYSKAHGHSRWLPGSTLVGTC